MFDLCFLLSVLESQKNLNGAEDVGVGSSIRGVEDPSAIV